MGQACLSFCIFRPRHCQQPAFHCCHFLEAVPPFSAHVPDLVARESSGKNCRDLSSNPRLLNQSLRKWSPSAARHHLPCGPTAASCGAGSCRLRRDVLFQVQKTQTAKSPLSPQCGPREAGSWVNAFAAFAMSLGWSWLLLRPLRTGCTVLSWVAGGGTLQAGSFPPPSSWASSVRSYLPDPMSKNKFAFIAQKDTVSLEGVLR